MTETDILKRERKLIAEGQKPPFVLRTTRRQMRKLARAAMKAGELELVGSGTFARAKVDLAPDERVVSRVGDTFLIVRD